MAHYGLKWPTFWRGAGTMIGARIDAVESWTGPLIRPSERIVQGEEVMQVGIGSHVEPFIFYLIALPGANLAFKMDHYPSM